MKKIKLSKTVIFTKDDVKEIFDDLYLECDFEPIWNDLINGTHDCEYTSEVYDSLSERVEDAYPECSTLDYYKNKGLDN